jgi:hypothetical protein
MKQSTIIIMSIIYLLRVKISSKYLAGLWQDSGVLAG